MYFFGSMNTSNLKYFTKYSVLLDVFDHKFNGIFKILDDATKTQLDTKIFFENILSIKHPMIVKPKPTEIQNNEFIIRHFVGDVGYNVVSIKYSILYHLI